MSPKFEILEARLLLAHPDHLQLETEPNDSFDTANTVELQREHFLDDTPVPQRRPDAQVLGGTVLGDLEVIGRGEAPCWPIDTPPDRPCLTIIVPYVILGTDYFKFDTPARSSIHIGLMDDLAHASGMITLYDAQQNQLASDANPTDGIRLEHRTEAGGSFFVQVASSRAKIEAWHDLPSSYGLNVRVFSHAGRFEHEPNDSIDHANPIEMRPVFECFEVCIAGAEPNGLAHETNAAAESGSTVIWPGDNRHGSIEGELSGPGPDGSCSTLACPDADFFSFTTDADRKIHAVLAGDAARDNTIFLLRDGSGAIVARSVLHDHNGDGQFDFARIEHFTNDGGEFYLQVESEPAPNAGPLAYSLHVESTRLFLPIEGPDESEPNDTLDQANVLDLIALPIDACCVAVRAGHAAGIAGGPTGDQDAFQFEVLAGETVRVAADPAHSFPRNAETRLIELREAVHLTVYNSSGAVIADALAGSGKLLEFTAVTEDSYFVVVSLDDDSFAAPLVPYRLHVRATLESDPPDPEPRPDPFQGPDENEPNDTPEQADELVLDERPVFAPGIGLRGGVAHGIAGGASGDVDVFQFEVQAGEHVNVGILGALHANPCDPHAANAAACVKPDLFMPGLHVEIRDAAGQVLGTGRHVDFQSDSDSIYYAAVSVDPTESMPLVPYRLGVLARAKFEIEWLRNESPHAVIVQAGKSFEFTDSDGDRVHVQFQSRAGQATITFTGPDADGSDIASIEIDGAARGGNLIVATAGMAEIGLIELNGLVGRSARRAKGFGSIEVDGNVGALESALKLRSIAVDGILGQVSATEIGRLDAAIFDRATADIASLKKVRTSEALESSLFDRFLPMP